MPVVRPRVALLIETSNAYARDLLYGVRSYLREHQAWSIYLAEHGRGDSVPDWLETWRGDGIIARVENQEIAEALVAMRLPTVDVSFGLQHSPFSRVATDSWEIIKLAGQHLRERGFQHFGYCGDARYHWSEVRRLHFLRYLKSVGFGCEIFPQSGDSWESEVDAMVEWIGALEKPTGILACYDIRGQQVLEACRRLGARVPDEVAVIGVHNDELLCDLCDPPLSSVIPNARRAGYEAASLLEKMMAGERFSPQEILLEPLGVATRQSTDVVALTDTKIREAVRFIRNHANERITVEDLLRVIPMSRTSFERRFKQALGCTPHEHLLRVRMQQVKSLLLTTDFTLAVIAERVGFEHADYMSVAFKRAVGISPSVFRTRNRS